MERGLLLRRGGAARRGVDDVGFIGAALDDLAARRSIDRRRVYAAGMSNGAMLAYRLAAEAPERFAAIAPVSGAIGGTNRDGAFFRIATPGRTMPVMVVHGRQDMYVLFDGGVSPMLGLPKRRNLAVADALQFWAEVDRCDAAPTRSAIDRLVVRVDYGGCAPGAELVLWELVEGQHVWPEGAIFPTGENGDRQTIAATILDFFLRHKRD